MNSDTREFGFDDHKERAAVYSDDYQTPFLDVSLQTSHQEGSGQILPWSKLTIANFVLFLFSVIVLITNVSIMHRLPSDYCVRKLSFYSPALDLLSDEYQTVKFTGHTKEGSPYQGPPNAEIDTRWDRLTTVGPFSLDDKLLHKIDAPDYSVKFPEESGGGYMAILESIHQLHCVNVLWQNVYPEYYGNRSAYFKRPLGEVVGHLDHCADMLRQKVMCDADVGIITYNWHEDNSHPVANFNTPHKCRNFDEVLDWSYKHQAETPDGQVHKPKNAVIAPSD